MVIRKVSTVACHLYDKHDLKHDAFVGDDDDDDGYDDDIVIDWNVDEGRGLLQNHPQDNRNDGNGRKKQVPSDGSIGLYSYGDSRKSFVSGKESRGSLDKGSGEVLEEQKVIKSSDKRSVVANGANGVETGSSVKKAKKRHVNVWAKTSRKGNKRHKKNGTQSNAQAKGECVFIVPVCKNEDKIEDGPGLDVLLSKFQKADKVELSDDRLSAGSTTGYKMVRATRGVTDGTWYFEITVEKLGPTGHTRLGWSTQQGELQAPVGFDSYSYAYRDTNGSKVHNALPVPYGEPYVEGDVMGFYINLPNGAELAPRPPTLVCYKGHPYILETKEEPLKVVPGSEIAFFRNGVCQGTAFVDISAGRYFPAASMYTLPNESNCTVKFCFGPDFKFPPRDIGQRPTPQAICFAPHCGIDSQEPSALPWDCESSVVGAHQREESKNPDS